MTSKRTLIRGGQVYDHEGDVHKPAIADILIEDDTILSVGANLAADGVHEVIDASGRLVVPGLINAHYHSHDVLCRGLFEELPLEIWLLYTLPMGAERSKDEVRTYLGGRAGVPAMRHYHGPRHVGAFSTQRRTDRCRRLRLSRSRHSRGVLTHGLGYSSNRDGPPQGQPSACRPGDVGEQAALDPRPARLPRAPVQTPSGGRDLALGHRAVHAAALHAEDAARMRRACRPI